MYILINSDKMSILAYSKSYEYLWELGCALCKDCAHVIPADRSLMSYSAEDVQRMYINLTQDYYGCVANMSKVLAIILKCLAQYNQVLPSVNVTTASAQHAIDKNIECMYTENGKIKEGFDCIKVPLSEDNKLEFLKDIYCDIENGNFTPQWPELRDIEIVKPVQQYTETHKTTSQRMSGSKQIIWEVATSMWLEAGSPTDKSIVLVLRKQIMNELEKQGVNRNSASNELGKWHKETAPF